MKRFLSLLAVGAVSVALANDASAQSRNFGAERFIMDDGDGHRMTLQTPALMDGNPVYTFPQFTGINTANVVLDQGVFTLNGQYTFTQEIIVNTGLNPDLRINENAIHRGVTPGNIAINPGAANFLTTDGSITQSGAGQNTFTGNVDATNGLDVTGALLTANAGATITGPVNVNATGTASTIIGNAAAASNTTINVGNTVGSNLQLNGIIADPTPTQMLTLTAGPGNAVRTTSLATLANEGVSWDAAQGRFELGGETNLAVPFVANPRWVNINASTLNFSSNGGALIPFQITGGAAPTINSLGTTNINTTGAGATNIGNAATGGAVAVATPGNFTVVSDDFLVDAAGNTTIDGTTTHNNSVFIQTAATAYPGDVQSVALRAAAPGTSWTGGGVFGGTGAGARAVIAGQLSGHAAIGGHNGVLSTWEDLYVNEVGGNVRIGSSVAPTSKLDVAGSFANTGNANIATAAASVTNIGSTAGGNVTLSVDDNTTTLRLVGIIDDPMPTHMLTFTNNSTVVNRVNLAGTANEGVSWDAAQFRYELGAETNVGVPFATNRHINLATFGLNINNAAGTSIANFNGNTSAITINGGASAGSTSIGNTTGTFAATGATSTVTGATAATLTTTAGTTSVTSPGAGGDVAVTANDDLTLTANDIIANGTATASITSAAATINTTGAGTTSIGNGNNALTLTGTVAVNGGAATGTTSINAGTGAGNVAIGNTNTAAMDLTAVDIDILGVTDITGTTTINTSGSANTTIGSNGANASSTTINVGTGGNLTLTNIDPGTISDDLLTITNGGTPDQVRRRTFSSLANEGVSYDAVQGRFELGGETTIAVPFTANPRYVNIDNSTLTFTRAGGAETALSINGATDQIDINTGTGNTNLGNAAGTNTILGTTNIDGNTTINDGANAFTTNIATSGNSGAVNIGNIASGGAVTIASDNDITLNADAGANDVVVSGDILPSLDNNWSLGAPAQRWINVYATPASFHTYGLPGEVGGSTRDWSMGINATGSYRIGEIATAGDAELFTISPAGNVTADGSITGAGLTSTNGDLNLSGAAPTIDLDGGAVLSLRTGGVPKMTFTDTGGGLDVVVAGNVTGGDARFNNYDNDLANWRYISNTGKAGRFTTIALTPDNSSDAVDLTLSQTAITRSGNIAINPGAANSLTTDGNFTIDGNILMNGGGTINSTLGGPITVDATGTTLTLAGTAIQMNGAVTSNNGITIIDGQNLTVNGATTLGNGNDNTNINAGTGTFTLSSAGLDVSALGAISNATSIQGTGALTMTGAGSTIGSGANATQLTISGVADAGVTNELVVTGDAQITGTATVGALGLLGDLDMNDNNINELDDVNFSNSGVDPTILTKTGGANLQINTTGGDLVVTGDGFSLATTTGLQVAITGEISHSGANVTVNDNLVVNSGINPNLTISEDLIMGGGSLIVSSTGDLTTGTAANFISGGSTSSSFGAISGTSPTTIHGGTNNGALNIGNGTAALTLASTGLNVAASGDITDANSAVRITDPQGLVVTAGGAAITGNSSVAGTFTADLGGPGQVVLGTGAANEISATDGTLNVVGGINATTTGVFGTGLTVTTGGANISGGASVAGGVTVTSGGASIVGSLNMNTNAITAVSTLNANGAITTTGSGSSFGSNADGLQMTIDGVVGGAVDLQVDGDANIAGALTVGSLAMSGNLDMNGFDVVDLSDITFSGATNNVTSVGDININANAGAGALSLTAGNFSVASSGVDISTAGAVSGVSALSGTFHGRQAGDGDAVQTINNAAITATSTIIFTYEDPAGVVQNGTITSRGAGTANITFAGNVPVTAFINYIVVN